MEKSVLDPIEDAIDDIRQGKLIIVVDDENRENEGDFVTAARNMTPELVNFMATHGRGLICTAITDEKAKELQLELMVPANTSTHETAFTVSIDLLGHGCTTGISASDRSKTIKALVDSNMKPSDFARPGHIFPLKAKTGGVLRLIFHVWQVLNLAARWLK
jgi:3,4-dihydroxy 2-butanone 4-phosphate synthase / GTP cyclohydrolase II